MKHGAKRATAFGYVLAGMLLGIGFEHFAEPNTFFVMVLVGVGLFFMTAIADSIQDTP